MYQVFEKLLLKEECLHLGCVHLHSPQRTLSCIQATGDRYDRPETALTTPHEWDNISLIIQLLSTFNRRYPNKWCSVRERDGERLRSASLIAAWRRGVRGGGSSREDVFADTKYENSPKWWDYQTCFWQKAEVFHVSATSKDNDHFLQLTNPPPPWKPFSLPPERLWTTSFPGSACQRTSPVQTECFHLHASRCVLLEGTMFSVHMNETCGRLS